HARGRQQQRDQDHGQDHARLHRATRPLGRSVQRLPGWIALCWPIASLLEPIMRRPRIVLLSILIMAGLLLVGPASAIMWKDYTRAIAEAENHKDFQLAFNEALVLALA